MKVRQKLGYQFVKQTKLDPQVKNVDSREKHFNSRDGSFDSQKNDS